MWRLGLHPAADAEEEVAPQWLANKAIKLREKC